MPEDEFREHRSCFSGKAHEVARRLGTPHNPFYSRQLGPESWPLPLHTPTGMHATQPGPEAGTVAQDTTQREHIARCQGSHCGASRARRPQRHRHRVPPGSEVRPRRQVGPQLALSQRRPTPAELVPRVRRRRMTGRLDPRFLSRVGFRFPANAVGAPASAASCVCTECAWAGSRCGVRKGGSRRAPQMPRASAQAVWT